MSVLTFMVVVAGWIFSLCLHEYAHARVALAGGDTSVRDKGYLSFNPLRYADPVYSILMPLVFLLLGGIGLPGGAVYIETRRLRGPRWRTAVSLAGPAANLAMIPVLAVLIRLAPDGFGPGLAFLGYLQVMAVLFNLLPIPPLDGYGALRPHLPAPTAVRLDRAGRWAIWVLFAVLWFVDPVANAFWGLVSRLAFTLGIPLDLAQEGYRQLMALTSIG